MQLREEVNEFDRWVRSTIAESHNLEEIHLVPDTNVYHSAGACAHTGFVEHVVRKHAEKIRVLSLRSAFVNTDSLKALLGSCKNLEEIHVQAGKTALVSILGFDVSIDILFSVYP